MAMRFDSKERYERMSILNPSIFRECDIRGVAELDLGDQTVHSLGRAFGTYLQRKGLKQALVGMDNRLSSPRLKTTLVDGLLSTGCDVTDIGTVTTPVLYYSRVLYGVDGAVMITGSHNPPDENGFKLACGPGTIYGEQIQELRRLIEEGDYISGRGEIKEANPVSDYLTILAEKIGTLPKRLKVVVDCGNGTASYFAQDFLSSLGCEAEIWGKFGTPRIIDVGKDIPLFENSNMAKYEFDATISQLIINGDFMVSAVSIEPQEISSLVEVYLQTLCFKQDSELPKFNKQIG